MSNDWLNATKFKDVLDYHKRQFEAPYESTKFIINELKEMIKFEKNDLVIDFGAGSGANLAHFSQAFPQAKGLGLEISEDLVEIGKKILVDHSKVELRQFDIFKDSYNGRTPKALFLIQMLSWFEDYKAIINKAIELKPKYIVITSLFYEGPIDSSIVMTDYSKPYGNGKYLSSHYNIYSTNKFMSFADKNGYSELLSKPFDIPIDLKAPKSKGLGTYTRKMSDGKRIQFSGPIALPWRLIILERES